MKKTTRKANQIREAGKHLFYKHGVKRISVDEICRVAEVSKKTFYNHFSNKFELAKIILKELSKREQDIINEIRSRPISFKAKMLEGLERKLENLHSIETEFLREVTETCDELKPFMTEIVREEQKEMLTFILEEQERGEIRKDISPHLILYLLVDQIFQMGIDPELELILPDIKDRVRQLMECFISGVSAKNPEYRQSLTQVKKL